jgi:hypothetical protein
MADTLGNTKKVILNNYLPKALIAAWNTRLVRRFQNIWLATAAAHEEYLLEATDFHSLADLHAFLVDMIVQYSPRSSRLASEMQQRFVRLLNECEQDAAVLSGSLAIPMCKQTLAGLYLYQEAAMAAGVNPAELEKPDVLTQLRPRQFIALAELLRHQLPTTRDPKARAAHSAALTLAETLKTRLDWHELFAKKEMYAHGG